MDAKLRPVSRNPAHLRARLKARETDSEPSSSRESDSEPGLFKVLYHCSSRTEQRLFLEAVIDKE